MEAQLYDEDFQSINIPETQEMLSLNPGIHLSDEEQKIELGIGIFRLWCDELRIR